MTCAYFSFTRSSMIALQTGQLNFFDGSEKVLYVPERVTKVCEHKKTVAATGR